MRLPRTMFSTAARMAAAAAFLAAAGCATAPAPSGDEAQVRAVLAQWKAAFLAGDVAGMMRLYADDYAHKGRNRADTEKEIAAYMRESRALDVRIDVEDATVTLHGDRADVMPVSVSGIAGSDSMGLELTWKNGCWQITGMDM